MILYRLEACFYYWLIQNVASASESIINFKYVTLREVKNNVRGSRESTRAFTHAKMVKRYTTK